MEKLINAMPLLTSIVLGVAITVALGWQGVALRDQLTERTSAVPTRNAERPARQSPQRKADLGQLTFFGKAGENPTPQVAEVEDLPETNLQLLLRGVMAGEHSERESALIEGPDGETEVYYVDQSLPGRAVLRKVHRRRVVIERAGELETLSFPEPEDSGEGLVASARDGARPASPPERASQRPAPSRDAQSQKVRERLNRLRERLSND